jgi:hypothetical protein
MEKKELEKSNWDENVSQVLGLKFPHLERFLVWYNSMNTCHSFRSDLHSTIV